LGFAGLAFVVYKLYNEYTIDSFMQNFQKTLSIFLPLLLLNVTATMIGIVAWHKGYAHYATKPLAYITTFYFFARTEIAKYLPGNVFHFIGRQALASKMGLSQKNMAQANIFATLILCIATLLSAFLMALSSSIIDQKLLLLGAIASLGGIFFIIFIYGSFSKTKKLQMLATSTLSIALQGVMLSIVIFKLLPETTFSLLVAMAAIYVLSWLVGFVTPGASGGLGVREGAFITIATFLHVNIAMDIIVFSVLYIRLINILSDITLYGITFFIKEPFQRIQTRGNNK
jgi:hypothetical protein